MFDSGDALASSYFNDEAERTRARKRAEIILGVYEKIGYDAINIGDTDMGLGIKYLRYLEGHTTVPFISANLVYSGTDKTVFKPYLIKNMRGLKVGIIGLLSAEIPIHRYKELRGYFIKDPFETAISVMRRLTARCDYLIVLAHLAPSEMESLAEIFPRSSIIIGGEDHSMLPLRRTFGSIQVQADGFGTNIGRLNLSLVKGSSEFVDVTTRSAIQKEIDVIQKKMENPEDAKEMKNLGELKEIFIQQMKKMPETKGKNNTYENALIVLHPGMKSDQEIEEFIATSRDPLKRSLP